MIPDTGHLFKSKVLPLPEVGLAYNMVWSQDGMIEALLKNFVSYSKEFKCECGYHTVKQQKIMRANNLNAEALFKEQLSSRSTQIANQGSLTCPKCNKKLTPEFRPNDLLN